MPDLPSGTVTFLFTDVEGSTRLVYELGDEQFAATLAEHRRLLRSSFERHGGIELLTEGDSFFVVFESAAGALDAAAEAQALLSGGPLRVRMGMHTGTAHITDEGYVGIDVHRAARIAAAGHGGQVLVSASTAGVLDCTLLHDLGEHRLKDLAAPERLFQLGHDEHPPLNSLYQTNLPVQGTPFLGRAAELEQCATRLVREDIRLLTLTGPGGTGKTRLAIQAAAEAADAFPDGIVWVPLAPLRDAAALESTVAEALGLNEDPGRTVAESLTLALAGKRTLVILDNAEHLLPGLARELVSLRSVDGPTLLVTSRERLQLQGEHVYEVPPFEEEEGLQFFLTRSAAAGADVERSAALVELCRGLDQLPLALELAAARTRLFSAEQLLERLGRRLDLLKGGRDAEPRQQTLRATIEWSYELLGEDERRLLAWLAVFPAGASLEVVERFRPSGVDALEGLIDKSLVRRRDTAVGPRFWMLETIREFAEERLDAAGARRDAEASLIEAAVEVVAEVTHGWRMSDSRPFLAAFDVERDNLRRAMHLCLERGDAAVELTLAAGLGWLWQERGLLGEAGEWLELGLAQAPHVDAALEGSACLALALSVLERGDRARGEKLLRRAASLLQGSEHAHARVYGLNQLASLVADRNPDEAQELLRTAAEEATRLGDTTLLGYVQAELASLTAARGDRTAARSLLEELIASGLPNPLHLAIQLMRLARLLVVDGELERAEEVLDEAYRAADSAGLHRELSGVHVVRAYLELARGNREMAAASVAAARATAEEAGTIWRLGQALIAAAGIEARWGDPEEAVHLWSAARALNSVSREEADALARLVEVTYLEPLRERLGAASFQGAWAAGQTAQRPASSGR